MPASTTGDLDANAAITTARNSEATFAARWAAASASTAPADASASPALNGQAGTVGQETVNYSWNAGATR